MTASVRPLPVPTPDSERFWRGCAAQQLWMQRCRGCEEFVWFPRGLCANCSSDALEWVQLGGRGTVYSFSHVTRPPGPAFPPSYVLALVDLDEGPRMLSHVVSGAQVRIGQAVRVHFEQHSDAIWLPVFVPTDEG